MFTYVQLGVSTSSRYASLSLGELAMLRVSPDSLYIPNKALREASDCLVLYASRIPCTCRVVPEVTSRPACRQRQVARGGDRDAARRRAAVRLRPAEDQRRHEVAQRVSDDAACGRGGVGSGRVL